MNDQKMDPPRRSLWENVPARFAAGSAIEENIPDKYLQMGPVTLAGHGANSSVYKIDASEPLALKVIHCGRKEHAFQSAMHEIRIMERLKGTKNTVQLFDYESSETQNGKTVYILERFAKPMANRFPDGLYEPAAALRLIQELCEALIECRNAGVYHLDVHPKNVFSVEGKAILGDFSAALFADELSKNRQMRGTLAYMAPEVYRDGCCSERSDIYSVGLMLYCLFHRHVLPFMDKEIQDVAIYKRLAGTTFPPIEYPNSEVREKLAECINRACAFSADRRYQCFEQLRDSISALYELAQKHLREAGRTTEYDEIDSSMSDLFSMDSFDECAAPFGTMFDADSVATTCTLGAPPASAAKPGGPQLPPVRRDEEIAEARRKALAEALKESSRDAARAPGSSCRPPAPPMQQPYCSPPAPSASRPSSSPPASPMQPPYFSPSASPMQPPYFSPPAPQAPSGPSASSRPNRQMDEPGIQVPSGMLAPGVQMCPSCGTRLFPQAVFCSCCGRSVPKPDKNFDIRLDIRQVQFSAIAPKRLVKGDYSIVHVIMYEEAFRKEVDAVIKNADEPVSEAKSGVFEAEKGAKITIRLSSPDLEIEDNEEERQWHGSYIDFSFSVFLPEEFKKRQVLFVAHIYKDDVILTKLKFCAKCFSLLEQKMTIEREDVLSAFVSYASQDRNRVATIIQGMKKARPEMDIFFDVESLRSGVDWEKTLRTEIEKRDILYLCWSHYAKQSKWVEAEWRYALSTKGVDSIEPVSVELPVPPPPDELSKKHFNDSLLYFIDKG